MQPKLLDPRPFFADITDPRRETKNKLHALHDILFIVLSAVLSGIEDWVGMEDFAREKESWLRSFITLINGIPSHDTLSNVMSRINPIAFRDALTAWATTSLPGLAGQHIAIDGKTLRGSRDDEATVHLLSAYASQARWILTQQAVAEKSNEITAIPDLLSLLDLQGAIVTIDAMGCQKAIAADIHTAGADYALMLKENHPTLHDDVKLWLDTECDKGRLPVLETMDKDHGRIEIRRAVLSTSIDWLGSKQEWTALQSIGRVESTRITGDKTTVDYRYYLCSFTDLIRFQQVTREHWAIENSQHWVLDVQFGEDANRAHVDHSAENLALVRRVALNMLRHNGNPKQSIRRRKQKSILNDDYRKNLILGIPHVAMST